MTGVPERPSPWYSAKEEIKLLKQGDRCSDLIACLTPCQRKIRLGVLINGRESSMVVPFTLAAAFIQDVQTLMAEKGKP